MKRLFAAISSFSEESEAIIKRARLLISSLSSSLIQDTSTISSNSQNEHNDTVEDIENEPELIDLTEDEPTSSKLECISSTTDIEECPICLETLSDLQSLNIHLIITPCHHVMCTLCSCQLLSTSSRCPLCRQNINLTTLIPYCILT